MQLIMYLNKSPIATIRIDYRLVAHPGYLGSFKRHLTETHAEQLEQCGSEPEFLVVPLRPQTTVTRIESAS